MTYRNAIRACVVAGLVVVFVSLGAAQVEAGPGDEQSALAQRVLDPLTTPSPPEPAPGNPAPFLQAILGQLVVMNNELRHATDAENARARACSYADKSYTEGAVLKVEGVRLLCVEAFTGSEQLGVGPGAPAASGEKRFVWEPLASPRLARFRETEWQAPLVK